MRAEDHLPLVRRVAAKMARDLPAFVDLDDLVSYGTIGLLRAIEHYDEGRGIGFETYAIASIRGCILDELRAIDWAPRSLRRAIREIDRARDKLSQDGSSPSTADIARATGMPADQIEAKTRDAEAANHKSLDEGQARELYGAIPDTSPTPEEATSSSMVMAAIADAIDAMPAQTRLILTLYYFDGKTLAEAASVAGIPETRASQMHTKAVTLIRERLLELLVA